MRRVNLGRRATGTTTTDDLFKLQFFQPQLAERGGGGGAACLRSACLATPQDPGVTSTTRPSIAWPSSTMLSRVCVEDGKVRSSGHTSVLLYNDDHSRGCSREAACSQASYASANLEQLAHGRSSARFKKGAASETFLRCNIFVDISLQH